MDSNLVFVSCAVLAVVSLIEVGMISSMVGFIHNQHEGHKTYAVNWQPHTIALDTKPVGLEGNQGHTTNGAAGYGFVLALAGMFVAWRLKRRNSNVCTHGRRKARKIVLTPPTQTPSKSLLTLTIFLFLETLLTLAALIYVFVLTHRTDNQIISQSLSEALADPSRNYFLQYPVHHWTPETWYKALLDLPLADESLKGTFRSHIHTMEAWRWFIIPMFLVDIFALSCAAQATMRQRRSAGRAGGFGGEK